MYSSGVFIRYLADGYANSIAYADAHRRGLDDHGALRNDDRDPSANGGSIASRRKHGNASPYRDSNRHSYFTLRH